MDLYIQLLVILVGTLVYGSEIQPPAQYAGCKAVRTYGYSYKDSFHIAEAGDHSRANGITLQFLVKAFSDAHILLSTNRNVKSKDPVYEIVIGAGRNTFTDIRRQLMSNSKIIVQFEGLLSATEYRSFWIRVTHDGRVEVGRAGDNLAFINWKDPQPLFINYFSFSTWGSYEGLWLYSCPNQTQAEAIQPVLTPTEVLRRDLLTFYDPYTRPVLNESSVTTVSIHLACHHVTLNEKQAILSVHGDVTMYWQDEKLFWEPTMYNNISSLQVLYHEVWQPEIVHYNAVGPGTEVLSTTPLLVTPHGFVMWKSQASLQARCQLNLDRWPHDRHTCELHLGFWSQQQFLKLQLVGNGTALKEQRTNSEWKVLALEAESNRKTTPWIDTSDQQGMDVDLPNSTLIVRLVLERSSKMYNTILVVPLLAISTMTLLSFWLSPMDSSKILLSCLNLIILSMFMVVLGGTLPAPADHVPSLVLAYSNGMVAVTLSLIISVAGIYLTRYKQVYVLPSLVRSIITATPLRLMLLLPELKGEATTNYDNLHEASDECPEPSTVVQSSSLEIQEQWLLLAIVIDRVSCLAYGIYLSIVLISQL